MTTHDRFIKKIKINKKTKCWVWTAGLNAFGYGQFHSDKKGISAHRYSYSHYKGKIPKGLTIDHLCRNRACANPDHLEAVTQKENCLRGKTITAINTAKTHCPAGHPYSGENLFTQYMYRDYYGRVCRACRRKHARASYKRRKKAGFTEEQRLKTNKYNRDFYNSGYSKIRTEKRRLLAKSK